MAETKTNIYQALLAAQKDMGPVYKNATNPAFKSKYADLSAVIETITEPLHKHGIVFTQRLGGIGENVTPVLNSALVHVESGEMIESITPIVCKDPQDPQKFGAAITYMRRYSLLALLGLAPEDDDGNLASSSSAASKATPKPSTEPMPWEKAKAASKPSSERDDGYYNEYDKKTYYPDVCSHCGREVPAKSVSFSMHKFGRVLCYDDQKLAEEGELEFVPEPITKQYGGQS